MDTKFASMPCDICGSIEKKHIGIPENKLDMKTRINVPFDMYVARCKKCGFYYTDPMPFWGEGDISKLYDHEYYDQYTEWWKNIKGSVNPNRRLDLIEKLSKRRISKYLEVGCGEGLCLEQAVKRGWEVFGQDVSPDLAAMAKQIPGVDIYVGTLEGAKYPENHFDAVYLDAVIEHVPQPTKLIREIYRILRPEGLVYIVCPNEDSLVKKMKQAVMELLRCRKSAILSPFVNPYHITGFNKRSLRRLAENNSFKVINMFVGKDYRSFEHKKYVIKDGAGRHIGLIQYIRNCLYFIADLVGLGTNLEAVLTAIK